MTEVVAMVVEGMAEEAKAVGKMEAEARVVVVQGVVAKGVAVVVGVVTGGGAGVVATEEMMAGAPGG